ncbi:MAG: site-specific tyrosine recombinase XerD [Ruminococcaceae bacterium]|nr:site-specific tyrosine recombinase XerD [Oscillospiraceae bacterium]
MKEIIIEYESYLREQKLSENTLSSYLSDLDAFLIYLKENKVKNVLTIKRMTAEAYIEHMKDMGKANSSISRTVASLKKFYSYLVSKEKAKQNPLLGVEVPRVKKKIPEALTTREMVKLLNQPKPTDLKGIRDKAMLELLYATGIKVSELITLNLRDIDLKGGMLSLSSRNERYIPIGNEAVDALENYIKKARNYMIKDSKVKNLFVNCSGAPLTRQGFWKILRGYAESAGIKTEINSQTLRNSFAVHLLQNGADINAVSEMLGHNDVVTTRVYNQVLKDNIKKIYKKAHPRA